MRREEAEKSSSAPSPAEGERLPDNVDLVEDDPTVTIIVGASGPGRLKKPKPSSNAPSPPKDGKVRPEDVVMEEIDDGAVGIIIPGLRKPPVSKPEPPK